MTGEERRRALVRLLRERGEPLTGADLAQRLGVSRQVIVQDTALLRAAGENILATARGYTLLVGPPLAHRAVLATRHSRAQTEDELMAMLDHGLRVLDVVVEHDLYGELRGQLMLFSRADVRAFIDKLDQTGASLLSELTGGVHLHSVEAPSAQALAGARDELRQRGFLLQEEELRV